MVLPSGFRDQVIAKLHERGVRFDCELCGQNDWSVVEQPIPVPVTSGPIAAANIPSAVLICNNCGNMRLLALGALDMPAQPTQPAHEKETA